MDRESMLVSLSSRHFISVTDAGLSPFSHPPAGTTGQQITSSWVRTCTTHLERLFQAWLTKADGHGFVLGVGDVVYILLKTLILNSRKKMYNPEHGSGWLQNHDERPRYKYRVNDIHNSYSSMRATLRTIGTLLCDIQLRKLASLEKAMVCDPSGILTAVQKTTFSS